MGPDLADVLLEGATENGKRGTGLVDIDQRVRTIRHAAIELGCESAAAQVEGPATGPKSDIDVVMVLIGKDEVVISWLDFHEFGSEFAFLELVVADVPAPGVEGGHVKVGACG